MKKQSMLEYQALTLPEQQALHRFKTVLESLLADNLISLRLFGSRARGEGTDESDLDVLIVLREKTGRSAVALLRKRLRSILFMIPTLPLLS
jgi:predicted nucleotidyltransferase